MLREPEARDRTALIELRASPEVGTYIGGPQPRNAASMRLATKLGFTEVERYEAWGADQWLGVWSPPA
ncbi:hypothetical protein ACWEOO_15970 [Kribbella sp. NPDC004138]